MKLGDLCDVVRGSSPRPQGDSRYFGGNIPRLMIADVTRDGKFVTPTIDSLTEEGAKKSRPMKKGDVVIAVSGDPGRPCILAVDACIHDGFVGLRNLKENKILKSYLFCFLNYFKLVNKKNAVGAIFKNLTTDQIKKIEIPEISIDLQINIVTILTQAENLLAQRKESIFMLDEFLNSSFLEIFGDPVMNEKGWEIKTIEQLVKKEKNSIKRGPFGGALKKDIFVKDGYLVYEQFHALNNDFSMARYFIDQEKFNELIGFSVKPKDIIISCSGVYLGKLAIIPEKAQEGIINQALLKLTLNEDVMKNEFFVFHFTHKNFKEKYFDSKRGAGIPNFPPMTDFKKFGFISPPIELQNKFLLIIEKVNILKAEYQKSLVELENMYGILSQKAFKDELIESEENNVDQKKDNTVMEEEPGEIIDIENYTNEKKEKVDITNMTFADYVGFPEEFQIRDEKWMALFLGQKEFYQFLLKDNFKDVSFNLGDIEMKFHNLFYQSLDMDFDNEQWRSAIFEFMKTDPPIIIQRFNEESATIKLELTDEAYKA